MKPQEDPAPILDEDKAEPEAPHKEEGQEEAKAIDLPIEENQFNVQPG